MVVDFFKKMIALLKIEILTTNNVLIILKLCQISLIVSSIQQNYRETG